MIHVVPDEDTADENDADDTDEDGYYFTVNDAVRACAAGILTARGVRNAVDTAREIAGAVTQELQWDRTLRTVEQLDGLPHGAAVVSDSDLTDIYVKQPEHHLACLFGPWVQMGYEVPCASDSVALPATLISHPDWRP